MEIKIDKQAYRDLKIQSDQLGLTIDGYLDRLFREFLGKLYKDNLRVKPSIGDNRVTVSVDTGSWIEQELRDIAEITGVGIDNLINYIMDIML